MRTRLAIICSILLFNTCLFSQPPETIYDGTVIATGFKQSIPLGSDGPFAIGFTFTFFEKPYSEFYVSANGLVLFTDPDGFYNTEVTIPTASTPNNYIAPFWDNLSILDGGNIMYKTIGASPNRKCIIQFKNMGFDPTPTPLGTFSVILYETSNKIQIQYRLIVDNYSPLSHGGSATIGIENDDGTDGVLFAFHKGDAVNSEDAISFTPSGSTYTIDPDDALYDGIFLTTNLSLPDPGIVELISPAENAVVGTDVKFEWSAATNATQYYLLVGNQSNFSDAVYYNAGTNLYYDISDLPADYIYYWTVISSNSTASTWGENRKLTTSSNPPLTAVPREFWVTQGNERLINLQYTGGDESPKTATITSLPLQGQLWQVSDGMKTTQITSVPAVVSNPQFLVIYVATGGTGNGAGSFKFKFSDGTGESPEATITINVNPPGIPNLLNTARVPNVELRFDHRMNNPAGKESQFTVTVNDAPITVSSASLKTGDPYTIVLTLSSPLSGSETVFVSYTKGDVSATTGGLLESFSNEPVTLKAQIITFTTNLNRKYGTPPFTLSATSSSGLTAFTWSSSNLAVATISGSLLTIRSVGTSEITAFQAGNTTYAPAQYIRTLNVSKADQTITFSPLPAKTYGDPPFTLSATSTSGLTVSFSSNNPSVASVTGNIVSITGAGTAIITASQPGNSNWNPAPDVQQPLTVNKANQTITFSSLLAKTYGDDPFNLSASSSSGLPVTFTGDNPSVAIVENSTVTITGAGTVTITASQPGNSNYNPAPSVQQTLTVNKADQTITFGPLPVKTYGDDPFNLSASSSSGLPVTFTGDNPSVAIVQNITVTITGAGTVTITASQPGNSNYNPAPDVQQILTVKKRTLVFKANDETREYNTTNPDFSYTVTGFVNGETIEVLDALPEITTIATQLSPAGTYPINISGGSDNNYDYTYINGTLTITKISQVIAFTRIPATLLVGDTAQLRASSTAGLEVFFESTDNNIATVSENVLTGVSSGRVQIRAFNEGNQNYLGSEAFAYVEIISTHCDIMYLFTPNGDGFNDYWELPDLASWGKCEVKVYNRWGKLVYSNPDYNNLWDGTSNGNQLPEGAYYFIIKTENAGTIKGTVNIVR